MSAAQALVLLLGEPDNHGMIRKISATITLLNLLLGHGVRLGRAQVAQPGTGAPQQTVLEVIAPKDLRVRAAANVPRVELSWTDNVQGESGFIIERSIDDGNTIDRTTGTNADTFTFIDRSVEADTRYTYTVRAAGPDWVTRAAPSIDVRTAGFRVFDELLYTGKPPPDRLHLEGIEVAYTHELFPGKVAAAEPHEPSVRAVARRAWQRRQILVLDVEHWPLDVRIASEAEVDASIEKHRRMIRWAHDERPDLKVGIYSFLPLRDYQAPVLYLRAMENEKDPVWQKHLPAHMRRFEAWQKANDRLRPLAEEVDFVCPSLYTFHDDPDGWRKYAEANLREARRYGKPVYPFLWPQFHQGENGENEFQGKHLSKEFWRAQLDIVRKNADGVVLWGGYQHRWDPQAPWWKATREFLEE